MNDFKENTAAKHDKKSIAFEINNVFLNKIIIHDIESSCRCNFEYVCFLHFERQKDFRVYHKICEVIRDFDQKYECQCIKKFECILH